MYQLPLQHFGRSPNLIRALLGEKHYERTMLPACVGGVSLVNSMFKLSLEKSNLEIHREDEFS